MQHEHVVTGERREGDLRALGVTEGQAVMLYASVKAVGWVVGGPDTVLRALLDVHAQRNVNDAGELGGQPLRPRALAGGEA